MLPGSKFKVRLTNTAGSGVQLFAASVFQPDGPPFLFIAPGKEEALYIKSDLENLLPDSQVMFLPDSFKRSFQVDQLYNPQVPQRSETMLQIMQLRSAPHYCNLCRCGL